MIHLRTPAAMLTIGWVTAAAAAVALLIPVPAVDATGEPPMPRIGLPGCNTTCGEVSVPFPFGMGPSRCYHSPGFKLTCDEQGRSKPPRLLLGDGRSSTFEVVDISLENTTMRVVSHGTYYINMSSGGSGRWSLGETLGSVPYFLDPELKEFILSGCNVQATLERNGIIVSGCASFCPDDGGVDWSMSRTQYKRISNSKACSNIGCCQTAILTGSAFYGVELQLLNHSLPIRDAHSEGHLIIIAEVGWLGKERNLQVVVELTEHYGPAPGHSWRVADHLRVPVTLHWTVPHIAAVNDSVGFSCPGEETQNICKSTNSECSSEAYSTLAGHSCQCMEGYQGNPYLTDGCQDIKECGQKEKHGCFGDCEELPWSFCCRCPKGTQHYRNGKLR